MPIYEFYCENCQAEYELIRPVSRMDEPAPCASCGSNGRRQLSYFSFKSNTFTAPKLRPPLREPYRSHDQEPSQTSDGNS